MLIRIKENPKLWHNTEVRSDKIIRYLLHHNSLTVTFVEGDVEGDIGKGRSNDGV